MTFYTQKNNNLGVKCYFFIIWGGRMIILKEVNFSTPKIALCSKLTKKFHQAQRSTQILGAWTITYLTV